MNFCAFSQEKVLKCSRNDSCACLHMNAHRYRGGSRIFSRGGADFRKIFQNFDDLFFLGRPN